MTGEGGRLQASDRHRKLYSPALSCSQYNKKSTKTWNPVVSIYAERLLRESLENVFDSWSFVTTYSIPPSLNPASHFKLTYTRLPLRSNSALFINCYYLPIRSRLTFLHYASTPLQSCRHFRCRAIAAHNGTVRQSGLLPPHLYQLFQLC